MQRTSATCNRCPIIIDGVRTVLYGGIHTYTVDPPPPGFQSKLTRVRILSLSMLCKKTEPRTGAHQCQGLSGSGAHINTEHTDKDTHDVDLQASKWPWLERLLQARATTTTPGVSGRARTENNAGGVEPSDSLHPRTIDRRANSRAGKFRRAHFNSCPVVCKKYRPTTATSPLFLALPTPHPCPSNPDGGQSTNRDTQMLSFKRNSGGGIPNEPRN